MMKTKCINWKSVWKAAWPHLVAISIFLSLTIIYFAPEIFDGKVLPQGDMISAHCMGADAVQYETQTGERPHWSNAMFGGMPHNYSHPLMPNSIYYKIAQILRLGLPVDTAAPLFILMLGFYVFMLCAGCSPWLSIVGAFAFAFASYNIIIIDAGHVTKAYVIATIPALLGGIILVYQKKYLLGSLVVLLATGMNVHWNHQQISYYALIIIVVLAIAYFINAIKKKDIKNYFIASCLLVGLALFAITPGLGRLIPTYDYQKETMRGGSVLEKVSDRQAEKTGLNRDYAFAWSYGKAETMTLLIPNFYGASSNYSVGEKSETYQIIKKYAGISSAKQFVNNAPMYWGNQPFTSGPVYAGAIICFLFILGLLVVENKNRWWLLAVAIIGIFLSWGRNFPGLNNWLFDNLPLYNKFRTPSMALVITTTAMAILAMMALKRVIDKEITMRHLYIAGGVTGALCIIFAIAPAIAGNFQAASDSQMPDWLIDALIADRKTMLTSDAWRSLAYIALSFGLIWCYLRMPKMKLGVLVAILGILILADLWTVDKRFVNDSHFVSKKQIQIHPTEANLQIMQDTDPDYRVLNLASNTFNESRTSYFHKSIGGYSPAKLRRYQDIIDYYFSHQVNTNVLNMLNTRYIITKNGVQKNPYAMGNAWFINKIEWVNTPNEEIEAIGEIDVHNIAVLDTCWQKKITATTEYNNIEAHIELTNYEAPDHLYYESKNSSQGLAVFSEIYYKTWKAYIDGEEAPVLRANYILRAIEIPAGKHQIEFKCVDELFLKCNKVVLLCSILYSIVIIGLIILLIHQHKKS